MKLGNRNAWGEAFAFRVPYRGEEARKGCPKEGVQRAITLRDPWYVTTFNSFMSGRKGGAVKGEGPAKKGVGNSPWELIWGCPSGASNMLRELDQDRERDNLGPAGSREKTRTASRA